MSPRAIFLLATLSLSACKAPDPPILTPERAMVTGVTAVGIDLVLQVDAFNPNDVDLIAQKVTAKVTLDGKIDLGTVTTTQMTTLPKSAHTKMAVPINAKWQDLSALGAMAASNRPIPFAIDGTQTVGGKRLNVDLPFHITGTLTHEQLVQATISSLPKLPFLPTH